MRQYKIEKVNLNGFGERKYYAVVDDSGKQVSLHYETIDAALRVRRGMIQEAQDRQRLQLEVAASGLLARLAASNHKHVWS